MFFKRGLGGEGETRYGSRKSVVVLAGRRYTCQWRTADLLLHGKGHGLLGVCHNSDIQEHVGAQVNIFMKEA